MTRRPDMAPQDLFAASLLEREALSPGARLLRGFARDDAPTLIDAVNKIANSAPFRCMATPGGRKMSVEMTNCGTAGWISDKRGYRYESEDPASGQPWPAMPETFLNLATRAATAGEFDGFEPDACLINRYSPGTRLSLHQDRDEQDFNAPIVSVSLGLSAIFLFGGDKRSGRPQRIRLDSGDVVVWGGPARLNFHGIAPIAEGCHPLTGRNRINLTFRKAL